ncbi:MAG TPA: NfeD family protein [Burkholderiales bacterium]|jgi:membrane protein implicated in regulation of membrane protease activity|nr:NfeD family protein [Burkholderiales bacterium]
MDAALLWAIVGLALVIVELLSGTFYLLMLGVAAFGAAGAAWLGYDFPAQVAVASLIAAGGCYGVHVYREKNRTRQMPPIDVGMPASFENWIDAPGRLARVRYRGASWDARVEGLEALEPGTTVYVLATDGNTLKVVKNRPG